MKNGVSHVILSNGDRFFEYKYKNEEDLEKIAISNKSVLFGENVIYFESKKAITSAAKITKIPDGLFITGNTFSNARADLS